MKRSLNIRMIALTVCLLLGTFPVVAAERPMAINGNGIAAFITDGAGNVLGANITASGTATHLGMWSTTGTVYFTPDPNNPGHILSNGTASMVAANGDKLQFVSSGALDPATGLDMGVFRFTGGTGRFTQASGATDYVVELNPTTGAFKLTAVGTINF